MMLLEPEAYKAIGISVVFGLAVAGAVAMPLVRAYAKRLEKGTPGLAREDADLLAARVRMLEDQASKMQELEERLDFAERLLAQQRDAPRIGP